MLFSRVPTRNYRSVSTQETLLATMTCHRHRNRNDIGVLLLLLVTDAADRRDKSVPKG